MNPPCRREAETRQSSSGVVTIMAEGFRRRLQGHIADISDSGLGVTLASPLQVGSSVHVSGEIDTAAGPVKVRSAAQVCWCSLDASGRYRLGLQFQNSETKPSPPSEETDLYDILQLSQHADQDTIARVHRMLAARYHPDNQETGDEAIFRAVSQAYRTLSDPERRAAYDAGETVRRELRWRLFDTAASSTGAEGERRKRQGILQLLYARRIQQPSQPGLSLREMEQLLDCPKEHLEFALWYLKENTLASMGDNGRYQITAKGVDHVEETHANVPPPTPLLAAAAH